MGCQVHTCFFGLRKAVALQDNLLVPAGQVEFGLGGGRRLERPSDRSGIGPLRPELIAEVRYFERYRTGWVCDGVLLSISRESRQPRPGAARCRG